VQQTERIGKSMTPEQAAIVDEINEAMHLVRLRFLGEILDGTTLVAMKHVVSKELSSALSKARASDLTIHEVMADITCAMGKDENSVDITVTGRTKERLLGLDLLNEERHGIKL
jgi:hypothetical protein